MKRARMNRSQLKAKKLAVLKVINEKKAILFCPLQNNLVSKKQKEEAWLEVLRKAQSLGLTTMNRNWHYARDHLFGLWKSRTLAKRDYLSITTTESGRVLDEVDMKILEIVEKSSSDFNKLELETESDTKFTEQVDVKPILICQPSFEQVQHQNVQQQQHNDQHQEQQQYRQEYHKYQQHRNDHLQEEQQYHQEELEYQQQQEQQYSQGTKRKRSTSIDSLKKEVLESELYINKLNILKLEKELGLPLSKFTLEFKNCNFYSNTNK